MKGIAMTIPNADFSSAFGNQITDIVDTPVTSVKIIANDYYVGTQYSLAVSYEPQKTSKKGVKWSITSGSEYCSIIEGSGVFTIFEAANMTPVTFRATSTSNESLYDEKEIILTYKRSTIYDKRTNSLGNLGNVDSIADATENKDKIIVKKAASDTWTEQNAPPLMEFSYTEEQVNKMIEDGTIDKNTLYFCVET